MDSAPLRNFLPAIAVRLRRAYNPEEWLDGTVVSVLLGCRWVIVPALGTTIRNCLLERNPVDATATKSWEELLLHSKPAHLCRTPPTSAAGKIAPVSARIKIHGSRRRLSFHRVFFPC